MVARNQWRILHVTRKHRKRVFEFVFYGHTGHRHALTSKGRWSSSFRRQRCFFHYYAHNCPYSHSPEHLCTHINERINIFAMTIIAIFGQQCTTTPDVPDAQYRLEWYSRIGGDDNAAHSGRWVLSVRRVVMLGDAAAYFKYWVWVCLFTCWCLTVFLDFHLSTQHWSLPIRRIMRMQVCE